MPALSPHRSRLLSVTESLGLPPQPNRRSNADIQKFTLSEWLVPPILLPIFLGLLIAAAVIVRW
jgi:hypothetical protein